VTEDPRTRFIEASFWHGSLERAEAVLTAHPDVASSDIHTAAILGDDAGVRRFLEADPASATAKSGPRSVDALTHLCFSIYLQRDRARSDAFVRAATALLDAGASAATGFWEHDHQPEPEWESVLYGVAGVAHHAEMTRLLLDRGADPNDGETPYHAPETYDNGALKILVQSGKLTDDSLATMLLRKADWHDDDGVRWLLEHGADPNRMSGWGWTALHQAIRRDNDREIVGAMLDHGADPTLRSRDGDSAIAIAARRGRGDLLALFERRGVPIELRGVLQLIAACARNDEARVRSIAQGEPQLVSEVAAQGGKLLAEFAGTWNTEGVRHLLDLGVPVTALYEGDGYFGIAKDSTALHVAAWKGLPATVKFLIERGSPVNAKDAKGRTPLMLAVKACVDSYWTYRRTPESVDALLKAGASIDGVPYPSGYAEVDELLRNRAGSTPV
jgi:ankyrin repeat protein